MSAMGAMMKNTSVQTTVAKYTDALVLEALVDATADARSEFPSASVLPSAVAVAAAATATNAAAQVVTAAVAAVRVHLKPRAMNVAVDVSAAALTAHVAVTTGAAAHTVTTTVASAATTAAPAATTRAVLGTATTLMGWAASTAATAAAAAANANACTASMRAHRSSESRATPQLTPVRGSNKAANMNRSPPRTTSVAVRLDARARNATADSGATSHTAHAAVAAGTCSLTMWATTTAVAAAAVYGGAAAVRRGTPGGAAPRSRGPREAPPTAAVVRPAPAWRVCAEPPTGVGGEGVDAGTPPTARSRRAGRFHGSAPTGVPALIQRRAAWGVGRAGARAKATAADGGGGGARLPTRVGYPAERQRAPRYPTGPPPRRQRRCAPRHCGRGGRASMLRGIIHLHGRHSGSATLPLHAQRNPSNGSAQSGHIL